MRSAMLTAALALTAFHRAAAQVEGLAGILVVTNKAAASTTILDVGTGLIAVAARRVAGHLDAGRTPDGVAYTPRSL